MESRLAKSAVKRLLRKHTAFRIREILTALFEATDFPLAKNFWNAPHSDVPLHCFFRMRREPLFHILSIREDADVTEIHVEIFRPRNRARILLRCDPG